MSGLQYLPASLWVIITGISLILVIISLGVYFWYRARVDALNNGEKTVASLAAREGILKSEIDQSLKYRDRVQEELLKLENQHQEQLSLEGDLAKLQTKLAQGEQKADELRKEATDLQNVVVTLTKDRDRLETENVDLEKKRDEANEKAKAAEETKVQSFIKNKEARLELEEIRNEIKGLNEKITDQSLRKDSLALEISDKETKLDEAQTALDQAKIRKERALEEALTAEKKAEKLVKEYEKLQSDVYEKRRHFDELVEKISERSIQNEAFAKEIDSKETKLEGLGEKIQGSSEIIDRLLQKIRDVENDLAKKQPQLLELEERVREEQLSYSALLEKNIENEHKASKLEARLANLEDKIEQYRGTGTEDPQDDSYGQLYQPPDTFIKAGLDSPQEIDYTEDNALECLKSYLDECKLIFPLRILNAFHTSLKIADISALAVMAGISGTGKTELPRRYAEALGMHFLLMAVQPRWDSPQDMFGFYNYIERSYKATELAQSLVRMDSWNHSDKAEYADRMLLVLLDEMNLARVEYYFSEFLSKLEIRRSVNPDNPGDRSKAEISLDVGPRTKGIDIPRLYVHENVLFVGTMNEDESTQTLSDKVIDRANVLRFGRPEKMVSNLPEMPPRSKEYLPFSVWDSWKKRPPYEELDPNVRNDIKGWIKELNDGLDDIGRPFGHRINQAIFSYVANYPAVNVQNNHRLAFADQIEQRILPKMRGLDIEQNRSCFEILRAVIEKLDDEELDDAFDKAMRKDDILFSWYGVTRKQSQ